MVLISLLFALAVSDHVTGGNIPENDHVADLGFQSIYKRLNSLEVNLKRHADENAVLKQTVEELREENRQLRNHVNTLQARDSDMENVLTELKKSVEELDACDKEHGSNSQFVSEHMTQNANAELPGSDQNTGQNNILAKRQSMDPTKREVQRRDVGHRQRRENEQNVAFFATLGSHLQHLGANQNIAFERVITNIGNGYNSHVGDFRAPVAGTYVFSVTLMAYGASITHYRIVRNSTGVANLYVRGAESPYASSSMTAVLELQKGEDVSIRNVDTDKTLHGSSYSAFSGFLLNQDFSNPAIVGK